MRSWLAPLQRLGRALMLPIAVLPVAGLLLRLGQPDLLGLPVLAAAGDAVFAHLGLLFALGVAVGLARENHGAAGLAALVGYLVASKGAEALLPPPADLADALVAGWRAQQLSKLSMPLGIVSGLVGGWAYNRFSDVKLPSYLAFFAGRRFVPIVTGAIGVVFAGVFGYGWPLAAAAMDSLSRAVVAAGPAGLFLYGTLNRLLIVTGLHHILNNIAWFLLGDFHGVTGDLKRFFAGDPTAGAFMAGFFPVMMFGLPGACLAMYHAAPPERRRGAVGLLASMALTSCLTGVTEPIEFAFMFVAPLLYLVHALLTGLSMVLMAQLDVHLGFGFSAGVFDYVLNFGKATHPWRLLPVGVGYFVVYYALFRYAIVRFDLPTPGRDAGGEAVAPGREGSAPTEAMLRALGGRDNLRAIDACTTRLRLEVVDAGRIDRPALKALGAMGVVEIGPHAVQVVLGPVADQVAAALRAAQAAAAVAATPPPDAHPAAALPIEPLQRLLGGAANIRSVEAASGRLLVVLHQPVTFDAEGLAAAGVQDAGRSASGTIHLIVGPAAAATAAALAQGR